MTYNTEQTYMIAQARYRWDRTGHPELIHRVKALIENEAPFSQIERLINPPKVKAEKPAPPEVLQAPPPLTGTGSTNSAWRAFAKAVSDMDPEVVDAMTRSDIVKVLVDKGVIDE